MKKYSSIIVFAIIVLITMICSITGVFNVNIGICISLGLVSALNLIVAVIALKHNIKVISITMFSFMLIGLILLGLNIYTLTKKTENNSDFRISVVPERTPKTQLFKHNNKNYYTYNLSSVDITFIEENTKYSLEEAITKNKLELSDILNLAIPNDKALGYRIYYDGGNSSLGNDAYSVIMCDNNDVIFSTFNYVYTEDICQN